MPEIGDKYAILTQVEKSALSMSLHAAERISDVVWEIPISVGGSFFVFFDPSFLTEFLRLGAA